MITITIVPALSSLYSEPRTDVYLKKISKNLIEERKEK